MWLDKATRAGLMLRLQAEQSMGKRDYLVVRSEPVLIADWYGDADAVGYRGLRERVLRQYSASHCCWWMY